jgi:hypothetical protein
VDEGFDSDPNTMVNLFRVRKDLGSSSTVGAVYTDRTVASDDYNRVAGADARLVMGGRYTLTLMGAASRTANPDQTDDPVSTGKLMSARIERAGRTFNFNAEFEDTDEAFDAGSGFFRRTGDVQIQSNVNYNWYAPRGGILQSINPSFQLRSYWDHNDFWNGRRVQEAQVQFGWRFQFNNNISFWGNHQRTFFHYTPAEYADLYVGTPDGGYEPFRPNQDLFSNLGNTTIGMWLNKWERVRGNLRVSFKNEPIFDRGLGVAVEPVSSLDMDAGMTLYPTQQFQMELGLRHSSLTRKDGSEYSNATIPRIRAQYQFSRALFVRTILEYSSQDRGALIDPASGQPLYTCDGDSCSVRDGSDANDFHVEGLVTYEPSPGTVFYVGYSRDMEDTRPFRFQDVQAQADGLFVKLSYRFRF